MSKYKLDYEKKFNQKFNLFKGIYRFLKYHDVRIIYFLRKSEKNLIYKFILKWYSKKYGIEIFNSKNIEPGLQLCHAFNITVNEKAKLGNNCVLFKNCTIGSIRSGKRAGVPNIGNNVVIGVGAFVCGGINIGNNVLIAANSFVNFDVPDNSLVFGNPGIIKHKEKATDDYIKSLKI